MDLTVTELVTVQKKCIIGNSIVFTYILTQMKTQWCQNIDLFAPSKSANQCSRPFFFWSLPSLLWEAPASAASCWNMCKKSLFTKQLATYSNALYPDRRYEWLIVWWDTTAVTEQGQVQHLSREFQIFSTCRVWLTAFSSQLLSFIHFFTIMCDPSRHSLLIHVLIYSKSILKYLTY